MCWNARIQQTHSASHFCMILNTCRELIFCSATPHPKIPCAPTTTCSLVGFPSAKSPTGENLPPETSHKEKGCWCLWRWGCLGQNWWTVAPTSSFSLSLLGEQTGSAAVCSTSGWLLQLLALNLHGYLQSVEWFDEHVNTMVKHVKFSFHVALPKYVFI